ncbi:hypothetical protein [Staphylococcus equorum]|uniref:hypothetical protein n=1 Tax=Staphylococcus equorum TaxID=246432 RepID=UPI003FD76274
MTKQAEKKSVITRNNKNYTSIFMTDFSDETLTKVIEAKETIEKDGRYSVIKPKKSAVLDYIERYDVENKIKEAKEASVGHQFEIGGCYFTRIEDMDNCYITLRDETDYAKGVISDFGTFGQCDILIEQIFKHKTGRLMFF